MPVLVNPFISFPAGGGADDTAHDYWRVLITTNNGDASFVAVGSLEMFLDYERFNKCRGGTPIASAAGQFGNVTANAFDQDVTTQWAEFKTGADWIGYHFASAVNLKGIMIRSKGASQGALMPQNFNVQWSDNGSSWTTRWSVTGADFVTGGNYKGIWFWDPLYSPSYSGSPITAARYWRFVSFYHTADTHSCAELTMATAPAGSTVTTGGTAIASNSSFGAAANAFDGNNTTFWAPSSPDGQWIGYDFGSGNNKSIAEMKWRSRSAGVPGQNPGRGVIQYSIDNTDWNSAWEAYDGVTWTDGMVKTFTDPLYV